MLLTYRMKLNDLFTIHSTNYALHLNRTQYNTHNRKKAINVESYVKAFCSLQDDFFSWRK